MEFVIEHKQLIQRVDRYAGFESNIDLAFLITVFGKDGAAIDEKTVRRQAFGGVVQFETLLRDGNGGQRGQSIDAMALNVVVGGVPIVVPAA